MKEVTLLGKYGIQNAVRKTIDLFREYPIIQVCGMILVELSGHVRASIVKHIYRWGFFGNAVHIGKGVVTQFKFNKYIYDNTDIRNYCKIEGKGRLIIGCNSGIGDFGIIRCSNCVRIGENVLIGPRVFISDSDHTFHDRQTCIYLQPLCHGPVTIEDDVFIGANVTVLKNVHIGRGAVIGAGSVIVKNVPAYAVVVGNPGRVVKIRGQTTESR